MRAFLKIFSGKPHVQLYLKHLSLEEDVSVSALLRFGAR